MLNYMPDKDYRAIPALNQSRLSAALELSASAWKALETRPREPSIEMLFGTLCHTMLLEPAKIDDRFLKIAKIDRRTSLGKAAMIELETKQAQQPDLILIEADIFEKAEQLVARVRERKRASVLFSNGQAEVSVLGNQIEGITVKGRLDYYHDKLKTIVDFKTTFKPLDDRTLERSMDSNGFKIQAAFYMDLMKIETGEAHQFVFLFAQTIEPFEIRRVDILPESDWHREGRALYKLAMDKIVQWEETKIYPEFLDDIFYPKSNPWNLKKLGIL